MVHILDKPIFTYYAYCLDSQGNYIDKISLISDSDKEARKAAFNRLSKYNVGIEMCKESKLEKAYYFKVPKYDNVGKVVDWYKWHLGRLGTDLFKLFELE